MFRVLHLFTKSLTRIATALETIAALYRLDLSSRGIIPLDTTIHDQVEISYGHQEPEREL